ncbi:hypothetical protein, partial [Klebsiella pneumoniae]|uniref:hypothetical protein n=1 Tax=Klebsiella pneumoniae TaxID=573 RepID=UPI003A85433B
TGVHAAAAAAAQVVANLSRHTLCVLLAARHADLFGRIAVLIGAAVHVFSTAGATQVGIADFAAATSAVAAAAVLALA